MQRKRLRTDRLHLDEQPCGDNKSHPSLSGWRPTCVGKDCSSSYGKLFQGRTQLLLNPMTKTMVCLALAGVLIMTGCSGYYGLFGPPRATTHIQTYVNGDLAGWETVAFEDQPFSSLSQHSFSAEGGDYDPDVSADGRWIVISSLRHSPNPDIYIKQVTGATATRLTSDPASEIQPAFSPSGDKVAYASNRANNWDIWVVGVDGSNCVQLTTSPSNDIHPSWSPDGKQIVYCSLGSRGKWEIWIVSVENPSTKKWIGYGLFPEWCPNPKISKIAYQQSRFRGSQWFSVWTIDMIDGEAKFPTEIVSSVDHACICPDWAGDGTQLVYSTVSRGIYEDGRHELNMSTGEDIWTVNLDGRSNLRLTHADASNFSPCWGSDGRVFFCSDRTGIDNIWSIRPQQVKFTREEPVDLTQHPQNSFRAN